MEKRARYRTILLILPPLAILASVSGATDAADLCLFYAYDGTGNRTAAVTTPATPVWGSTPWGCFRWTP